MPKSSKLHAKGKPSSIQKPCKVQNESADNTNSEEAAKQFQLELCWCIQQLERTLNEKKGNEKQLLEAWKVLAVLKNNNQSMIRKRQLMRTHFGDYRGKMATEEKKLVKMTNKMKITDCKVQPKATYLRKSLFSTTGNESFRFNFDLNSDQLDRTGMEIKRTAEETENNSILDKPENVLADNSLFKFTFTNSQSQFKFNFDSADSG